MFDLIREIGQTLRNNKLRTALTGVAVSWGIFMLIVLLGAARGVVKDFNANTNESTMNTINIWGGRTSMPYKGYKDGRWIQLHGSDMEKIKHDNPNVSSVIAFASADTAKISTSRDYVTGFNAVYPRSIEADNVKLKYGRFLNDRDIADCRRVMVLHETNARLLFGDDAKAVGSTVQSMGLAWTVVGVFSHQWRNWTYAPYTTYKKVTGNNDRPYQLNVSVEGMQTEADGIEAENGLRATLAREHQFDKNDPNAIWTWNRFTSYLTNRQGLVYLNLAVWVIGIFTLLSGIVGVSNIMFVSVRERTHEIGIRRAIGAKPRSILTQVLAESVAVTALFGYIGVFAGMVVLQVVSTLFTEMASAKVDLVLALQVTIALVVAGAAAGFFPALKAIKVKPVEALRDE
nr:ABC transporter permease [Muribaculaceae bacterium]